MTATLDYAEGIHLGVEYYPLPGSLSVSSAKTLLKAPALYKWQREHPVETNTFDFGKAAHAQVLGVGCEILVHEYDATKIKSPKSTNAWKSEQAEARKRGAVLLLPDELATVQAMADQLANHATAMRLLTGGQAEVYALAADPATGVMRRAWIDYLTDAVATDYKSAATVEPAAFAAAVARYGYHQQAAWTLDLLADLGHPAGAFAFIAQEKEPPYLVEVYDLDEDAVARGRELNRRALERFRDCTDSGLWPGYTAREFTTLSLPRWAYYDGESA